MRSEFAFLVLLSIPLLSAQQATGPIEGFTFDPPTMSLRPVIGSLGSASLGQPLLGRLAYGTVAPQQNYALIFREGRCSLVLGLGSAQTSTVAVPGSFVLPEGVAWSGDGSTAILYSRTGDWVQVLSGLPSSIHSGASLSVAPLGGALTSVTADLHGSRIAIGVAGGTAGVYQLANGTNFVPLLSVAQPISLAYSQDGVTLYTLDGATDQVFAQNTTDLTSQSWPLTGLTDPIAIEFAYDTANRAVIYLAGRNDQQLVAYDASTHQLLASMPLSFQPNAIQPLGINSFLLGVRTTTDDILWSFRNTPQPTVYFVPAPPVAALESGRK